MSNGIKEDLKLRQKIYSLTDEILGEVDHGECFYDREMLNDFLDKLDDMKILACRYYDSNREGLDEDDE